MTASAAIPRPGSLTGRRAIDDLLPAKGAVAHSESPGQIARRRLREDRTFHVALVVFTAIVVMCFSSSFFEKHWAHTTYSTQDLSGKVGDQELIDLRGMPKVGPGLRTEYTLGTDPLGRDLFMRVLQGGKISLTIGFGAALLPIIFGVFLGTMAGFMGGRADMIISRTFDVMLGFPGTLFAIALSTALSTGDGFLFIKRGSVMLQILILGFVAIAFFGRIIRSQALSLGEREFVEAARALGAGNMRIMGKHILPHLSSTVLTYSGILIASLILAEAGLSFLGVGVLPPMPSWGNIIADGKIFYSTAWWVAFFPGLFIMITVLSLNLIGQSLEEALDPKSIGGK